MGRAPRYNRNVLPTVHLTDATGRPLGRMPLPQAEAWAAAAGWGLVTTGDNAKLAGLPGDPLPGRVVGAYPAPIAACYQLLLAETHPFTRVHRLIDAFTATIEFLAIVWIEDALRQEVRTEDLARRLHERLPRPLTSAWVDLFEAARRALEAGRHTPFVPGLARLRLSALAAPLLALRNRYAHGAVPDDDRCTEDFVAGFAHLHALLAALDPLRFQAMALVSAIRPPRRPRPPLFAMRGANAHMR